jgi:hypothetical protein
MTMSVGRVFQGELSFSFYPGTASILPPPSLFPSVCRAPVLLSLPSSIPPFFRLART